MKIARFVVLYHEVGTDFSRSNRNHFDWMFERNGTLQTWATDPVESFQHAYRLSAVSLSPHRLDYLDYEGEISGNRGRVRRVLGGTYELLSNGVDEYRIAMTWQDGDEHRWGSLRLYRNTAEDELRRDVSLGNWCLFFEPGRNETKR